MADRQRRRHGDLLQDGEAAPQTTAERTTDSEQSTISLAARFPSGVPDPQRTATRRRLLTAPGSAAEALPADQAVVPLVTPTAGSWPQGRLSGRSDPPGATPDRPHESRCAAGPPWPSPHPR